MTIQNIKKKLKIWYDNKSKQYESLGDKGETVDSIESFEHELRGFKSLVKIKQGDKVLDIATGTGIYLLETVKDGAVGYGIDISNKMLEVLLQKSKKLNLKNNVQVRVGTAEKLEFPNGFFDWILCIGMFEYYPIDFVENVLNEIKRVAKPTAKIIVDFPNKENPKTNQFKESEKRVGNKVYVYDLTFLKAKLINFGFKIEEVKQSGIEHQFLLSKLS